MTHRGPFQPLLFCDSVILSHHLRILNCNSLREPAFELFSVMNSILVHKLSGVNAVQLNRVQWEKQAWK